MTTNLAKFRSDLKKLTDRNGDLLNSAAYAYEREAFAEMAEKQMGAKAKAFLEGLPKFEAEYQAWYSEAIAVVRQLLPDRLADFIGHYEPAKNRKELTYGSYRIQDALQGLTRTVAHVKPSAAITHLRQQTLILSAAAARFESSLFDIRQMVQADLFDSELDSAAHLLKFKFVRAAGAVAGVVLEGHLGQVCLNHSLKVGKKNPTISDFNELLKGNDVIDVPAWRFNQHLADIRNLCDHHKDPEPTDVQVKELIDGVRKVTKTIF